MPTLPNTTRGRRVLIGAAFLSLFVVTFLLVKDKDQKESQPESDVKQIWPGKGVASTSASDLASTNPMTPQEVDPQWLLRLPEGGGNTDYVIDPTQAYIIQSDGQRSLEEISSVSSIEDFDRFLHARACDGSNDIPHVVMYPQKGPRNLHSRRLLGQKVSIKLTDNSSVSQIAKSVGATNWRPMQFMPGRFILETAHGLETLKVWRKVAKIAGVITARPLLARRYELKYIPRDPLFPDQWHLEHTGQVYPMLTPFGITGYDLAVRSVWSDSFAADGTKTDGLRGSGVVVSIVDDGIDALQADLAKNVNTASDYDYFENDFAPYHGPNDTGHGTSVAGLVAARGNNKRGSAFIGAHGVAPDATLVGLRLISGDFDDEQSARALLHLLPDSKGFEDKFSDGFADQIHISNNSWGPADGVAWFDQPEEMTAAALEYGTQYGRKGRGLIYVWAGGNGGEVGDNSNYDGYANSIHTIAVGASSYFGDRASYSEPGTNLVVAAPSGGGAGQIFEIVINGLPYQFPYPGVTTTDIAGFNGYNQGDYTPTFNGTSAAAPMVSGVVALMLEANPALGWRDIQELLLRSANILQGDAGGWTTNKAGLTFHPDYGSGGVNGEDAVAMARKYEEDPSLMLGRQFKAQVAKTTLNRIMPLGNNPVEVTFQVSEKLRTEHVTLEIDINHANRGELQIDLISPSGTSSRLLSPHSESGIFAESILARPTRSQPTSGHDVVPGIHDFTFSTLWNWGEDSEGEWMLVLRGGNTEGLINSLTLNVFGTSREAGKVIIAENKDAAINVPAILVGDSSFTDGIDAAANVEAVSYEIEIDANGVNADTFLWKKGGITQDVGITITGNKQILHESDGLYVLFQKTQGYTIGTAWTLNVKDDTDHDGMPDEWESQQTTYTQPNPDTQPGLTVSGSYNGIGATHYIIEVDGRDTSSGAYTFRWSIGSLQAFEESAIIITGLDQELSDGLKIKFDSTINHSIGDKWTFSALELNKYFDDSHLDPDGDKRTNLIEYLSGTDPIVEEPAPEDQDSDLLLDLEEVLIYNTDPTDTDSDGDGIPDGTEVYTYSTDPTNPDTDGDGIDDNTELTGFAHEDILNPTRQTDPLDPDSDSDGMLDGWERLFGLDPLENDSTPRVKDTDRDRLSNYQEYLGSDGEAPIFIGTVLTDTNGDGKGDLAREILSTDFSGDFTNPQQADTDEDTFTDYDERIMGTNPNDATSSLHITSIVREEARKTDSVTWYSVPTKIYYLRYSTESPTGPFQYITNESGAPREIPGKRESRRTTITHFTNGIPTWYRVEQKVEIPESLQSKNSPNPTTTVSTHRLGDTAYLKKVFGPFEIKSESTVPASTQGRHERVRILQPSGGLPPLRVVELLDEDAQAGTETVVSQLAMAANRVLVQTRDDAQLLRLRQYASQTGATVPSRELATGLRILNLPSATLKAVPAAIQSLRGKVSFVEPDYVQHITLSPNDPDYLNGNLWGLHNTGQNAGTDDADIDAPEAWDQRTDASEIVVAVIDTGVRYTHEDLVDNMWVNNGEVPGNGVDDDNNGWVDDVYGVNAFNDNGDPMDQQGHGTHCAGTVGGVGNNGIGITGVAWDVQIMACQFLSPFGFGMTADAIECIDYARQNGAHIMSNSWGGGGFSQALYDAISRARDEDILFTAAAGNSGSDNDAFPHYPSSYDLDNIVAVAATDRNDDITWFSCFGATSVDIGAPGQDIYSAVAISDNAYDFFSGTSMACPHVSGALALMKAAFPSSTYDQLIQRLYDSADPIPALTGLCTTGARLNISSAMEGGEAVNVFAELDTDQDGLTDFYEKNLASFYAPVGQEIGTYTGNSDPLVSDTDGDGIADGWEVLMGLDPVIADADADPDQDGLQSIQEYMGLDETPPIYDYKLIESTVFRVYHGDFTRADIADSDGDGLPDGWEVLYGLDATVPAVANGADIYFAGNNIISSDTTLNIFRPGDLIIISGTASNDGTYTLDSTIHQEAHKLTTVETLVDEPAGLLVSLAKDSDQDGLSDLEEYTIKSREPYFSDDSFFATALKDGKVISEWSNPIVANDIKFTVDETTAGGPYYHIESISTDLSMFAAEGYLTVTGTVYNNGNFTVISASNNKIVVKEPTDYEAAGKEVTIDLDLREKAFTGIFTYPDEADTDGDGATDGEEVAGIFGGSNPTDSSEYIATLAGKFVYTGIEQGTFHLILTAYGADEDPDKSGQTDFSFESASRTIRSASASFPSDIKKWDTFSIFGSDKNDGVYTVVASSASAITVKENLTDEAAGATVYFRRDPQRILVAGSGADGDAYSVSGIPTQLQYSITGFLDTNSNGVLDRLIDPHVHFLDGGLMPGTDFNDLNIDLPHVDPEGAKIRILSVEVSDPSAPLVRTITWRSIPGKTYRVRYSTATPAGPFDKYVLGTGGAPKEIIGYAGQDKTSLIHFADNERTFYRVEVKSADSSKVEGNNISFSSNTRAIIADASLFPVLLPGQRIYVNGSQLNDGLYTVSREVDATDQQIILEEDLIDEAAGATIAISSPGAQLTEIDSDGDGLTDFYEELLGLDPGSDSDGDGLIDDTDDDGLPDGWDSDGDGLPDGWEVYTGLTVYANDISFSDSQIRSISGVEFTSTDISFDSSTRTIQGSVGDLTGSNFIAGQQIFVTGSGRNSGIFTVETANPIQIKVEEELFDENAGRAITLSSVGGTDLSVFPAGTTLKVKGSAKNDGSFFIQTSDVTHTLEIQENPSAEEAGDWITLYANDTEGDPDGDLLSNLEEFLGADEEISLHMDYLVGDRLFDGDWTHPVHADTDSDSIDDGWEIRYGLNPNQSNGASGTDIGFRENRARTISSITISGQNIRFDGTSSRIISLTNEFTSLSQCRQITIIGSESNDGSWSVIDSGINGDYLEVAPSPTGDVILDEQEGLPISIHGDLEVLSNDITFDGNTITSSPTTISGNDISFTAAGEILNLGGQGVMGDDISFEGTSIRSHNGLTTGQVTDDISFDAASSEIRSAAGVFPDFSPGYTIQVVGAANAPNNGVFFVLSTPNPGFALQVFGALQDEGAQNGGNNPQPKNITVSSVGGTDLSIFNTGFDINVTGSFFNDGTYAIAGTPTSNQLDVGALLTTETSGFFVNIDYANPSDFSLFRMGQEIEVTGSISNNGTHRISDTIAPTSNTIVLAAGANPTVTEPVNAFTTTSITARAFTSFSQFEKGAQIQITGSISNDGIYTISTDIAPTFSQIQVLEPFTPELAGQDLEIFQLGPQTRLNAFNDLENVLVTGSLANDGTYVIAPQGVSPSTLFFQPGTLFVPEASGAQVSIAKDLDNDGLPDGSEYHYNSNPNRPDTDSDGDLDLAEVQGHFGGSDPTNPQSVLRSINGSIQYVGSEVGNIYIKITETDREFTISDLHFDSSDHSIRSANGNLPYLTVGRQILISGAQEASNNRVFTITKVIASKYAIEVEEEPVDEDALGNDLSVTVISYEPILVQLAAGERTYSVDGLASDLKISIAAFLDANGNGELDEFADPNGVYNEGVAVEVGTSGRFNLNLDLGKDNLSIISVTAESAVGGYYHTITWNSLPSKQYRVLYSNATPAGPFDAYVTAADGRPTLMTGRDGISQTSLVHFTESSPVWYRVEMVNSLGEGIPETDADGDGLTDFYENKLSLDADNADVDEDGLPDGWEVLTGLTAYGNDLTLDGNTGEIRSIFDLSIESELISFNASANQIILSTGSLPAFITGQRINILGSKVNDGIYSIKSVDATGTSLTVEESLTNETSGASTIISSIGGTDLSVYQDGAILVIKGTTNGAYDGIYQVSGDSTTSVSQLSAIGGGNPDFQNGNGHPASVDLWLTLYASDADANPDGDGWHEEDATGTTHWHPYTNIEEYHGADEKASIFRKDLISYRVFDGDWTDPNNVDTDGDGIDDGWELSYGLDPSSLNGVFGSDLSFKETQVRSVESISVAGKNISFEADTGRIRSLSSSFLPLANSSWITITGSSFNNGVFEVESVSQFGEFITIMPSHVLVEEVQGADVLIQTDRDQTGSDISFNGNTIRASRTTATGSDVFFQQTGFIRSLGGQTAQGDDLEISLNEVRSHFGLTTGAVTNDISFDAATSQVTSFNGNLPAFIPGQQILVLGANINNGFFTVDAIINPGFTLRVIENLTDEGRQNAGNPPPPKIITISSVGGTDLSGFPAGFQVEITGSALNNGIFTLAAPSGVGVMQFTTAMLTESAGAPTQISIVGGTDLSQFKAGQDIIVTGSNLNDGTYRIAPGTPPTADRIALEFDPLNPVQLQNEPALANRAPTVSSATSTILSMFTKGGTLLVSGTTANDGIYQINPFIDPTSDTIQVLETFTTEPAGSNVSLQQAGSTDLSGFAENNIVLISGSFLNDGVYTIAEDGVAEHSITFAPSGTFSGFLREPAAAGISISKDFDNDGLADVLEYQYQSDPSRPDSDGDGATDIAEVNGHFGGSNPTDKDSVLSSIVGTIAFDSVENGTFFVKVTPVHALGELVFDRTTSSVTSTDGLLPHMESGDRITFSGTSSNDSTFTVREVMESGYNVLLVEEVVSETASNLTIHSGALLTPLLPNQRSFAVTNLPSDADIILEAFLDTNGNSERDNFLDPYAEYNGGNPLKVGVGGRFNIVLDLSLTPLRIDSITIDQDPVSAGYNHTVTWMSVPDKTYRVRYSIASPAGPFENYVTARTGLPEEIVGKAGVDRTSLIHFAATRDVFYRVEQVNEDGTIVQEGDSDGDGLTDFYEEKLSLDAFTQDVDLDGLPDGWEVLVGLTTHARDLRFSGNKLTSVSGLTSTASDIRFVASTITGTNTIFPAFLPGQQISVVGSGKNDGIYTLTSDGISSDGKTLTIDELLTEEVVGANVTIASVGGTDLSIYPSGLELVVKGSDSNNDGTYYVQDSSANALTLGTSANTPYTFNAEVQNSDAPHYITLHASDADTDADSDGLTNSQEYLGADLVGSSFDATLLGTRVFDGDYTNATLFDTDGDTMDDGWERQYGLNPNALNGVSGNDLGFRGLQIRSISSIPISGRDFNFDTTTNRISALTTSFKSLQHARQITIAGSSFNDGTYTVLEVDTGGAFIDLLPTTPLQADEKEGSFVSILGDREILGNDISFDGFSISSTPTQATGQDIHFEDTGAIRSLLGVAVEGADLGFIGNQISSHFGLSTGVVSDDISFDAATGQIRSVAGNLPNFVSGFQIQVTGAILNNGTFTVTGTPTPGFVVQVAEALFDEANTNTLLPGTPKDVTISSVGGTDLSTIPAGFDILISGSGFNNGVQTLAISTSNVLTVLSGFANETPGNTIRIEINEPTDFSNFRPGQLIEVTSSRRNDGEYIIARVSPNMIEIQFDPTGPAPLTSDAATALTEASVQAVVFSDLTTFQKGSQLFLNGSLANSGILRVSPFFDPTLNEIQVLDLLTSESAGQDLDVYQIGSTLLSGFNDGDTVLISGSLVNDGKYTLEHNGVTGHSLNFRAEPPFTSFVTEAAGSVVSISKDLDSDGLPDVREYIYKSDPTISDTDNDGDTDLAEADARFFGSDPNDSSKLLTSVNGNIEYEGSETGTVYIVVQEHDSTTTLGSLEFDAASGTITSSTSQFPFLVAGRTIEISGTVSNNGIFTISSVHTPGSKILVVESLADEAVSPVTTQLTVKAADPEIISLPVGVLSYSVDRLVSGSKVSISAYLDTDSDGEYDTFIDPLGEYPEIITLGPSPRFNLNLTLRQGDLTLANVSPLNSAGTSGFANAITWNSIPGKIYRILVSHDSPAGPYDKYVESLTGFPQEITGRYPDPVTGISQTYVVHISEKKDTWYRLEMVSEDRRSVTSELDTDSDGLTDFHENQMGLDPEVTDTDRDGLPDGWETLTGLTAHGSDISFTAPSTIRSIAGLHVTGTDLTFDAGTRTITSSTGAVDFSDFINGQQVTISGSLRNDGTYTLIAEPTTTVLTLEEQIFDEDAPATGVLISSLGGTDLSVFSAGVDLTIIHSASNDGTFKVADDNFSSTHTLRLESTNLNNETHDLSTFNVTLYSNDPEADPDGDGLTNMDEFLGSDSKAALYTYALVQEQLFDGDWTHPLLFDTDGDGIDDGWEVEYSLNPNKIDQLEGQDLSLRGNRIFSIANKQVNGVDISFNSEINRIHSAFPHFRDYSKGQLIRVEGSESNDGTYTIASVTPNEVFVEEALTATEAVGTEITIFADISVSSANLAMDESSIYSGKTAVQGGDVTFSRDRVESLFGYSISGTDLIFRDKEITSTSGLKYLVHEAAPQLYALRGAEMTTEDGLTLNFVEGQNLIMRNLTIPFVDYFSVRRVQFGGEKVTFSAPPPFNQSGGNPDSVVEWTEIFTEPGSGTDLSLLVPGLQIEITGSQFNDGVYNIEDVRYGRDRWVSEDPFGQQRAPEGTLDYSLDNNNTTTVLTLDTPTLFTDEAFGREITITVLNGSDLSEFRPRQEFDVTESYANNGTYEISPEVEPTPNTIIVHDHVFNEEPRLLSTEMLSDDISFVPFGLVHGNSEVPSDGALQVRHPVINDPLEDILRFNQTDLETGGRGQRLNIINWSTGLLPIRLSNVDDGAGGFDPNFDIYFQRGDVIAGLYEVTPEDPILGTPAVMAERVFLVVGDGPGIMQNQLLAGAPYTTYTEFVDNTNVLFNAGLGNGLLELDTTLNPSLPVATVFEPDGLKYELGEVVYDNSDGNYYIALVDSTTEAENCTAVANEWLSLGSTPLHMGNLEEYSPKLSYDRGAMVEFEGNAYVASEDINIGEDEPDENSPAWIEPSIYLGSSFIMSESGALPKLLEGTKINVFVEWEGEHRDLGGPFQDWPFWTLGSPDANSGTYTVKSYISPFIIEIEESVVAHGPTWDITFSDLGFVTATEVQQQAWSALAGQLVQFAFNEGTLPARRVRLFVNSYSEGQNPEANLQLTPVDLSFFQPGQQLTVLDSSKNDGTYTISEEAASSSDRIYLQEPLYLENDGLKTTIFQSGETDLSGFGFGSNFILGGSDNNDGKYTVSSIKPNTSILEVSREFSQEEVDAGITEALFTEATGHTITMGIDSDDDDLSNNQEYVGSDGISPGDPGDGDDATAPILQDFDRDGYSDSLERGGLFGGSKAEDINSIPASISGTIDYNGTLDGEVILRIREGDDPDPAIPNDIILDASTRTILSRSGALPVVNVGDSIHLKGTILDNAFNSTDVDDAYTVESVTTQGSEIIVEENIPDTSTATLVFIQHWDEPGEIDINLGEPGPYTLRELPSHKTYHVDAFLDVGNRVESSSINFDPVTNTISADSDLFTEFTVGQTIRVSGSEAIPVNDGTYTLTGVTGTTLTVAEPITTEEDSGPYIILQGLGNGSYDENAEPYGSYTFATGNGAIQLVTGDIPISHLNNINIQLNLPEPSIVEITKEAGKNTIKWNSIAGKTYRLLYSTTNAVGPYSYIKTLAARSDIDNQRATFDGQPFEWDLNGDGITDPNEDLNGDGVLDTPTIGNTIDLSVTTIEGQSTATIEHFIQGDVWYRVEMENGAFDIAEQDSDADGLSDYYENLAIANGGSATVFDVYDSDGDGMGDGWEVFIGLDPLDGSDASLDADGDGLSHYEEFIGRDKVAASFDYSRILTDVFAGDWTYSWPDDLWSVSSNPETTPRNRTPDGISDGLDSDGDGMRDGWEVLYALNPNFDDSQEDTDNDGWDHDQSGLLENTESYTNIEEYVGKDGGAPVLSTAGGLLLSNGATFTGDHTNPQDPDTDGDSFLDGREADVAEAVLFGGSDPNDDESTLLLFTGTLYSDNGSNNLRVGISDDIVTTANVANDIVSGTGAVYQIIDVPTGNYIVYAFEDQDSSGAWGGTEPSLSLGGHGNPTKDFNFISFDTGSPTVILDFDVPAAFVDDSVAPSFADWGKVEGLTGVNLDPEIDSDGDGIANFIEYASNTGPLDPDSKPSATFSFENTLGGLLEAEVTGHRLMTISHPWNGVLAGNVVFEIQASDDLNNGWATLTPGDGILHSLSLREDRIEAKILCSDVSRAKFTRFIFKEAK